MIDTEVESVTANEAAAAGLVEAIENRQVCFQWKFRAEYDGSIIFKQNPMTFKQSDGTVRCLKFDDPNELNKFVEAFERYKKAESRDES